MKTDVVDIIMLVFFGMITLMGCWGGIMIYRAESRIKRRERILRKITFRHRKRGKKKKRHHKPHDSFL